MCACADRTGPGSLAVGVNLVLYGLTGPFAAAAMLRFGIRRVVVVALGLCALGSGLAIRMTQPWQLVLLWGVVVGLGTGSLASVFAATVADRWFVAKGGLVTGVLTAAGATGQLAFLPLLAGLAMSHGWRSASATVASPQPSPSRWCSCCCATVLRTSAPGPTGFRPTRRPIRHRSWATRWRAPSRASGWHRRAAASGCSPNRSSLSPLALPTVLSTGSFPLLLFIAFYGLDWAFGSYSPAFITAGRLCAAAAALAWSVGRSRVRPARPLLADAAPLA